MKNIFTKKNLMPLIVLSAICIISAALMGGINLLTADRIAFNEEQKIYDSLREVLDGTFETVEVPASAPSTVTGLFKVSDENGEFKGNVVTVEQKGYAGKILLTIGFDKDGKTTKVVITAQSESHGKNINPLLDRLSGISADDVSGVDVVTGATISLNGYMQVRATKVGKDTTLLQIIKLVEDAQGSKAPIAKLAEKAISLKK